MPLGKPEIDQAISSFRSLAVELLAHRNKLTREAAGAGCRQGHCSLCYRSRQHHAGADTATRRCPPESVDPEHLQACRLMRAWYEVQNGIRQPVPVAERAQLLLPMPDLWQVKRQRHQHRLGKDPSRMPLRQLVRLQVVDLLWHCLHPTHLIGTVLRSIPGLGLTYPPGAHTRTLREDRSG